LAPVGSAAKVAKFGHAKVDVGGVQETRDKDGTGIRSYESNFNTNAGYSLTYRKAFGHGGSVNRGGPRCCGGTVK